MKKKLTLENVQVQSFVTKNDLVAGLALEAQTQDFIACTTTTWYSELYTACNCPESWNCTNEAPFCL